MVSKRLDSNLRKNLDGTSCSNLASDDDVSVSILFCFCVLDKKWACYKHFNYHPKQGIFDAYVNSFFTLNYKVSGNNVTVVDQNGWIII